MTVSYNHFISEHVNRLSHLSKIIVREFDSGKSGNSLLHFFKQFNNIKVDSTFGDEMVIQQWRVWSSRRDF